jgi:hypothetical protein
LRIAAAATSLLTAITMAGPLEGADRPEGTAVPSATAPAMDGDVLDDRAWDGASRLTGFTQTTPREGEPVSEQTEVRVLFTEDTVYFGVVCHDREPDRIIVSDSRCASPLDDSDSFQILLDTYRDRQSGFVFGTNASGLEYDAQVVNEGQGSQPTGPGQARQQSGAQGGFNLNWDGVWSVKTKVGEFGWSAEFAIPFRTLRYASGGEQEWGVNFQRNIRRHKEVAYWAALSRQYTILRVSDAFYLTPLQGSLTLAIGAGLLFVLVGYLLDFNSLSLHYDGQVKGHVQRALRHLRDAERSRSGE